MTDLYDDADVQAAVEALEAISRGLGRIRQLAERDARAVLDTVIPAVAARAKVEALRDAEAEFASRTQEAAGQVREHWRGQDFVDGQDTAYERAADWLRDRAFGIERGQS